MLSTTFNLYRLLRPYEGLLKLQGFKGKTPGLPCIVRSQRKLESDFFVVPNLRPESNALLDANLADMSSLSVNLGPTSGVKRKRESQLKFYAVRVGKNPGIYNTWDECLEQVKGVSRAQFKSFASLTDASQYVNGETVASGRSGGTGGAQKWYGVQSGRVPGVYTNYQDVQDQIVGWKLPKHRAFKTRTEAEMFVAEGQKVPDGYTVAADGPTEGGEIADIAGQKRAKVSKSKKIKDEVLPEQQGDGEYEPGEAPLAEDAEDNFDTTITLDQSTGSLRYKNASERTRTRYQASAPAHDAPIVICTDGSSLANGQAGAVGGIGVYFGPQNKLNISEALPGTKQTNQRAELTAIYRALEVAPCDRRIVIRSDSNYSIKCVEEWFQNWRRNGWVNASKKPVENRDLIQKIVDMLDDRRRMNEHRAWEDDADGRAQRGYWDHGAAGVKFVWIKGHANDEGNVAADRLATAGAREAKEMLRDVVFD